MTRTVTLVQINDTHGYLEPHPELFWESGGPVTRDCGGFARIATIIAGARRDNPWGVLVLDNGDTFHGTPALVHSRGEAAVPVLRALGVAAMTGHWDFAYGPAQAARLAGMLGYPMLAANAHRLTDDAPSFQPTLVCEAGGVRVGVIGLAATILDDTMPPEFSEGLKFTDGIDETRQQVARLRGEGCELVVVLSHLGLPQDAALARAVDGIDVILSGHTHNRLATPWQINGALIIQSGCHASFVGRLDLTIEAGRISGHRHRLVEVDDRIDPDPQVAALVADAVRPVESLRAEVVGRTDHLLHRMTCLDAPMDDALLAAIAAAAGTEMAFSNGWRYGAAIPTGEVTLHDLWCIIPTDPPVETVELTGAEILTMMEGALEATFSGDPFGQRGGYLKRFRGLTLNAKLENPAGHRIEHAWGPDGAPIRPEATYRAAFVTRQGVPGKFGRNRRDTGIAAIQALRDWFGGGARLDPALLGRVRVS